MEYYTSVRLPSTQPGVLTDQVGVSPHLTSPHLTSPHCDGGDQSARCLPAVTSSLCPCWATSSRTLPPSSSSAPRAASSWSSWPGSGTGWRTTSGETAGLCSLRHCQLRYSDLCNLCLYGRRAPVIDSLCHKDPAKSPNNK